MRTRIAYVRREWLAQLMEYLEPQERFTATSGGIILSTYGGNVQFMDESYKPVEEEVEVAPSSEFDGDY